MFIRLCENFMDKNPTELIGKEAIDSAFDVQFRLHLLWGTEEKWMIEAWIFFLFTSSKRETLVRYLMVPAESSLAPTTSSPSPTGSELRLTSQQIQAASPHHHCCFTHMSAQISVCLDFVCVGVAHPLRLRGHISHIRNPLVSVWKGGVRSQSSAIYPNAAM